jgi:hypothetical protein
MQRNARQLSDQLEKSPLSNMSIKEIVFTADSAEKQMRDYQQRYSYEDSQISLRYYDHLEGQRWHMTPKEIKDWTAEEEQKRLELGRKYEPGAQQIIANANRIRAEMLGRLFPSDRATIADSKSDAWFEAPKGQFLWEMGSHANYLDRITRILASSE